MLVGSLYRVARPRSGSLGALFVPVDFRIRLFASSGLTDRPSEGLSIQTIPLSGYMYRRSRYIFLSVLHYLNKLI